MPKLLRLSDGALIDVAPEGDLMIDHDRDLLGGDIDLANAQVVCIHFPKFKDGRAFTQARLLRERFGYKGEIRACGHVIPDQVLYLQRLGVDAVELEDDGRVADFRFALRAYSVAYQRPGLSEPAYLLRGKAS